MIDYSNVQIASRKAEISTSKVRFGSVSHVSEIKVITTDTTFCETIENARDARTYSLLASERLNGFWHGYHFWNHKKKLHNIEWSNVNETNRKVKLSGCKVGVAVFASLDWSTCSALIGWRVARRARWIWASFFKRGPCETTSYFTVTPPNENGYLLVLNFSATYWPLCQATKSDSVRSGLFESNTFKKL